MKKLKTVNAQNVIFGLAFVLFCAVLPLDLASATSETSIVNHQLTVPQEDKWFCTAEGIDWQGRRQSISSDIFPTQDQAERAAFRDCFAWLRACQIKSCINEAFPF